MSSKKPSCGILVVDDALNKILLCHVTHQKHWDIPKGRPDDDEAEIDTAIRETREECGLVFNQNDLLSLGKFEYTKNKDLVLYLVNVDSTIERTFVCETKCFDHKGVEIYENDDWKWVEFDKIEKHCTSNMFKVLSKILNIRKTES